MHPVPGVGGVYLDHVTGAVKDLYSTYGCLARAPGFGRGEPDGDYAGGVGGRAEIDPVSVVRPHTGEDIEPVDNPDASDVDVEYPAGGTGVVVLDETEFYQVLTKPCHTRGR